MRAANHGAALCPLPFLPKGAPRYQLESPYRAAELVVEERGGRARPQRALHELRAGAPVGT
jgi:hypothetical protein